VPDTWRAELRAYRLRRGLTQAQLAKAAGVSTIAVKSYEGGTRRPSVTVLRTILQVLAVTRLDANRIRRAVGHPAQAQPTEGFWFTQAELSDEVAAYPWPVFIVHGGMEVLMANAAAACLWNVDLESEFVEPGARSLIAVASNARFAERVENWDEALTFILGHLKGASPVSEIDQLPADAREAIERFLAGNPKYLSRLLAAWQNATPLPPRFRYRYRVHWRDLRVGLIRFRAVLTSASLADELAWNEWIPADAESWHALEDLLASANHPTDFASFSPPASHIPRPPIRG
jgi:transcriptional regulator with XRE-family HTH domain